MLALLPLLLSLGVANSRNFIPESAKTFRSLPAISNSLVNLGKMDIALHFNSKSSDPPIPERRSMNNDDVCPCTSLRSVKNAAPNTPELLSTLLMNNDVLSSKNNRMVSSMCCDSHENVQEDTFFFEISPKNNPLETLRSVPAQSNFPAQMPNLPFIFENVMSKLPLPVKPKAIEIFFYPKKKDLPEAGSLKRNIELKKSDITVVGDKELKNEIKNFRFKPPLHVKKSTIAQENKEITASTKIETQKQEINNDKEINIKPNTV